MKPCKTCKEFSCAVNGSDYVSMKCGAEEGFVRIDADCVSLRNAAELVEELRDLEYAKGNALSWVTKAKMRSLMLEAAYTIEQLLTMIFQKET